MCTRKVLAAALSVLLTTSIFGALPSTWRATYAPTNSDLKAIASGAGQIVAVGQSRTIITSSDGLNWTQAPIGGVDGFQAIAYGNGKFVAGGHDSAFLATSTDGINWSSQSTVGPEQIEGLAFGSGRFVAVGQYVGRDSFVITSQNGTLWGYPVRPTT